MLFQQTRDQTPSHPLLLLFINVQDSDGGVVSGSRPLGVTRSTRASLVARRAPGRPRAWIPRSPSTTTSAPIAPSRNPGPFPDRSGELRRQRLQTRGFRVAQLAQTQHFLDPARPSRTLLAKNEHPGTRSRLHERVLEHVPFPVEAAKAGVRKLRRRRRHRQRRATRACFGIHNLRAAVLDPMRQRPRLFRREPALGKRPGLREQGEDGDARVAADDGDVDCGRVAPSNATQTSSLASRRGASPPSDVAGRTPPRP